MIPKLTDTPARRKILAALEIEPEYQAARNALRTEVQRKYEAWQQALGRDTAFYVRIAEEKEKWLNILEKILIIKTIQSGRLPGITLAEFRQSVYPDPKLLYQDWQLTQEEQDQLDELEASLKQYEGQDVSGDETIQRWLRRSKVMLEIQRNHVTDSFRFLSMLRG